MRLTPKLLTPKLLTQKTKNVTPLEAQAKLDKAIADYGTRATLTSASSVVEDERAGTVTISDNTITSIRVLDDEVELSVVDGVWLANTTATIRNDVKIQVGDTLTFGGWTYRVMVIDEEELSDVPLGQKLYLRSI
ncbi:hypothetical protein ACIGGE_16205 [Qipengyuania sp. NPDC077410]|uniref:hypothetical protein n=1 Tax=Qipengyuania sp. NPDC077410 TaxID=3364496 RepID=UPI0037CCBD3A